MSSPQNKGPDPESTPHALTQRLREQLGDDADPRVDLRPDEDEGAGGLAGEVVRRLSGRTGSFGRYELKGEIARGGQGAVLKVWDTDLRRTLAMKVVLGEAEEEPSTRASGTDARTLGRFLEEAQVTGQLDHPGIVPIHELGLDDDGRVYFTMKLVRGRELARIFDLVHAGEEDWTTTRVLGLILKVCEAMAYAHHKGVLHRDLKPANVMVGRYGAVYVMDWGIARVLDREDGRDIRVRKEEDFTATFEVQSERRESAAASPFSPLMTMDGDVIGTPAYMSPEQARGDLDEIGPQSDVYSVGAMLYHLLTGRMPYVPPDTQLNNYAVWALVQTGPPQPVAELAPETLPELIAICEKAMRRDLSERYASMEALARDIQAFIEGRVVEAYGGGTLVEARKWIRRNRALAASLAAAVVLAVGGAGAVGYVEARGRRAADAQRAIAETNEALAVQRADDVLRLSALQKLDDLATEADALWPAEPKRVESYEAWLLRAHALVDELQGHVTKREEIRSRATEAGRTEPGAPLRWRFQSHEDRWWHAQLTKLIDGLEALADPEQGRIAGVAPEHGWSVERRLEFRTVEERTVSGAAARVAWQAAADSIANPAECPAYEGLTIRPQLGLFPIGRDRSSGLWEFWHVQSGAEPARDGAGDLVVTEEMGIVLVLVPGGSFWMGAQGTDRSGRNFYRDALSEESPVHEVRLSPFFLSKYELTQAQWKRFTGTNPSYYGPDGEWEADWSHAESAPSLAHPVEQVTWYEAKQALERVGLALPTEAQWEYGTRAGTQTPWWTGRSPSSLEGKVNLSDAYRRDHGGVEGWEYEEWDDGNTVHAPVGSYRANAFGLHDVLGNVWEWCLDGHDSSSYERSAAVDPVTDPADSPTRMFRGGSFYDPVADSRSSDRNSNAPDGAYDDIGLRPARKLTTR